MLVNTNMFPVNFRYNFISFESIKIITKNKRQYLHSNLDWNLLILINIIDVNLMD